MEIRETDLMAPTEAKVHSFVVRLWPEQMDETSLIKEWRGWIEPVENGRRHYFRDVSDVSRIIDNHLSDVAQK